MFNALKSIYNHPGTISLMSCVTTVAGVTAAVMLPHVGAIFMGIVIATTVSASINVYTGLGWVGTQFGDDENNESNVKSLNQAKESKLNVEEELANIKNFMIEQKNVNTLSKKEIEDLKDSNREIKKDVAADKQWAAREFEAINETISFGTNLNSSNKITKIPDIQKPAILIGSDPRMFKPSQLQSSLNLPQPSNNMQLACANSK